MEFLREMEMLACSFKKKIRNGEQSGITRELGLPVNPAHAHVVHLGGG